MWYLKKQSYILSLLFTISLIITALLTSGCEPKKKDPPHISHEFKHNEAPMAVPQNYDNLPAQSIVRLQGCVKYEYWEMASINTHKVIRQARIAPVRYAEVRVYQEQTDEENTQSSQKDIQAGFTDEKGCFDLKIPKNQDVHIIQINSRTHHKMASVSILKQTEDQSYYFVEKTFVPNQDQNNIHFTISKGAYTLASVPFFLLDQIIKSNLFLRKNACPQSKTNCLKQFDFTRSDFNSRLRIFWKKGFNPGTYLQTTVSKSFYWHTPSINGLSPLHRIFISGGQENDLSSDTDHWDDSIIIHEYAHFLEKHFSQSEAPGGSHYGIAQIDPRQAWSEGWANFFQAAVRDTPNYMDSAGFDISPYLSLNIPLETPCREDNEVSCYSALKTYEGHFREFAIARFLWDMYDNTPNEVLENKAPHVKDCIQSEFHRLWNIFVSRKGLLNPNISGDNKSFTDIGLFQDLYKKIYPKDSCWNQLKVFHGVGNNRKEFAFFVSPQNHQIASDEQQCFFSIDPILRRKSRFPELLDNHDFFHYRHTANNTTQNGCSADTYRLRVELDYAHPQNIQLPDLDLFLYTQGSAFQNLLSSPQRETYNYNNALMALSDYNEFISNSTDCPTHSLEQKEYIDACVPLGDYLIVVAKSSRGKQNCPHAVNTFNPAVYSLKLISPDLRKTSLCHWQTADEANSSENP